MKLFWRRLESLETAVLFGGEKHRVRQLIDNDARAGYATGVSLMAVLKKL